MLRTLALTSMLLFFGAPVAGQSDQPDSPLRLGGQPDDADTNESKNVSAIAASHEVASREPANGNPNRRQRKTIELSAAVSSALKAEAVATDTQRLTCIRQLSALYSELAAHERFAKSQLLQRQHRRIFVRMVRAYDAARHGSSPGKHQAPGGPPEQAQIDSIKPVPEVLGQFVGPAGNAAGNQVVGGSAGGASNDYSDELIDIITRTIQPETWTQLGGSSAIVYYRPSLALVMTAPQEVHDAVARLLGDLRAASGP